MWILGNQQNSQTRGQTMCRRQPFVTGCVYARNNVWPAEDRDPVTAETGHLVSVAQASATVPVAFTNTRCQSLDVIIDHFQ